VSTWIVIIAVWVLFLGGLAWAFWPTKKGK
jgi:cbb3-type cytochrome oxidase subunit 3